MTITSSASSIRCETLVKATLRFISESPALTRVELEHRQFERHGADAAAVRAGLAGDQGWAEVLRRFTVRVADTA
jgi:hypothetical protein